MVDFGIISLVVIQIILAIVCLWSWHSNKIEYQTLKTAFSDQKDQLAANARIVVSGHEKVSQFENRVSKIETMREDVADALRISVETKKIAIDSVEEIAEIEKSMKAKFSAYSRWNKKEIAAEAEIEEANAEPVDMLQIPGPPLAETAKPSTFGKVATR